MVFAFGVGIMQIIRCLCVDTSSEDPMWFPYNAGSGNPDAVMKYIWANYRDESFITQFLSLHLMRHWKLFKLLDEEKEPALAVDAIHNERGYGEIRRSLARQYDVGWTEPDIQVVAVDMRSEEHTSELQSLMRITYEHFYLK